MKPSAKKRNYLANISQNTWYFRVCPCRSIPKCFLSAKHQIFTNYIIVSCQEKNPDQKILIFHDEKIFSKFEIWNFLKFQNFRRKNQKCRKTFFRKIFFKEKVWKKMFRKNIFRHFWFFHRKFWNFKKCQISNFENIFSSWKINIFHPIFFWQGMIILHRKITLALSLFNLGKLGTGTGPRTLQIHPDLPSSYVFSREASHVD